MTIRDLEVLINTNNEISVIDMDYNEIAKYDGRESLEDVQDRDIYEISAEADKIILQVY